MKYQQKSIENPVKISMKNHWKFGLDWIWSGTRKLIQVEMLYPGSVVPLAMFLIRGSQKGGVQLTQIVPNLAGRNRVAAG